MKLDFIKQREKERLTKGLPEDKRKELGAVFDELDQATGIYGKLATLRLITFFYFIVAALVASSFLALFYMAGESIRSSNNPYLLTFVTVVILTWSTFGIIRSIKSFNATTDMRRKKYVEDLSELGVTRSERELDKKFSKYHIGPLYALYFLLLSILFARVFGVL